MTSSFFRSPNDSKLIPHSVPLDASVMSSFRCLKVSNRPKDNSLAARHALRCKYYSTFVNDLTIPNNLNFLAFLNDTFRDTATSNRFHASTGKFDVKCLKDGCLPGDSSLVDRGK